MKIKSGTEELIAKYLLGDITEHEKKQLDNWIKTSPQHEEFFNRLRTSASFRKRYEAYTQINSHQAWRCVVMHDAPLFLFITIQICSLSLSCDLLKISLIYVFPASKNSSCKLIKQFNQPVHTLFCQFCTHLFYIEGNG